MGLRVSWYRCPVTPLGFLPCASAAPPSAASPSGFGTLDGCVSMSDSSLLVYSWGGVGGPCCATWLSPMCRALPQGLQLARLSQLQVPLGFSGHRVSVLLLPWWCGLGFSPSLLFWASPAPLACWGSWSFAPCVRVLLLWCCLLGLQVRSPCCPSLTLGWVCFWPEVSQPFVGCEGGLGCPSWFVTALGS